MADERDRLRDGHARLEAMIEEAHLEEARSAAIERPWMNGLELSPGLREPLEIGYDRVAAVLTPDQRGLRDVLAAKEECRRAYRILDAPS